MSDLLTITAEDIPYRAAFDAHRGTSYSPDRRAEAERAGYVAHLEAMVAEFAPLATTDEQRTQLAAELERYRMGYRKRVLAVLAAQSRTLSAMITGPSKFPTRRNQKALDVEHRRREELIDWSRRAQAAIRRTLTDSGRVSADDPDAPETLRRKIEEGERLQAAMKTANKIARTANLADAEKLERMVACGLKERTARAALEPDYGGRTGFPAYVLSGNLANIKRLRARLEAIEGARAQETTETAFDGGVVVDDVEANRVRIVFDEKPDAETRAALKSRGFRWAPSAGAWQRQRTAAARQAAADVLGMDAPEPAAAA